MGQRSTLTSISRERTCSVARRHGRFAAKGREKMLDLLMLVLGIVFFAGTIAYAYACDRL